MNYKVYTIGNAFFVENESGFRKRANRKDVLITFGQAPSTYVLSFNKTELQAISISNILKEDGSAYSQEEFEIFANTQTGDFNTPGTAGGNQDLSTYATLLQLATKVSKQNGYSLMSDVDKEKLDSFTSVFTTEVQTAYDNTYGWVFTNGDYLLGLEALLKDGVSAQGDTLQKLYNLILGGFKEVSVATIAERNALNITSGNHVFVTDDGDGKWATYKATSSGVNATYVKLSDPDLLNALMSNSAIKTAYESNSDTNAFTNTLKAKLDSFTEIFTTLLKSTYDSAASSLSNLLSTGSRLITNGEIIKVAAIDQSVSSIEKQAWNAKADNLVVINDQIDNYTLVLADLGKLVRMNKATALTATVPPNSAVAFPIGAQIPFSGIGAGQLSVIAGAGVTINSAGNALKLRVQFSVATLIKTGIDTWLLTGDITI